ncbi:MAG: nucleotidyltransferase substrate binding protein [Alphaproteobacteria bacterium]
MMKRVLKSRGLESGSPKDTFRKAAIEKLIDNPEVWFDFQLKRNLTAHTYHEETVNSIVSIFDIFSRELSNLIQNINTILQE